MVQITPTEKGSVILESIIWITDGQKKAIKANPKAIKNFLEDLHKNHVIAATEDGNATSKMYVILDHAFDVQERVTDLQECHQKFLKLVDTLSTVEHGHAQTLGDENVRTAILADIQEKNEKDASKDDDPEEDDVKFAIIGIPVFFI